MIKNYFVLFLFLCFFFYCKSPNDNTGKVQTATKLKDSTINSDPLPSWNEGSTKISLIDYVTKTTKPGSAEFIQPEDRIATFDNDGTLWAEQPLYFQIFFSFDRIRQMAPKHPEWKSKEPFKSLLGGNMKRVMATGEKGLLEIVGATSAGMNSEEYNKQVSEWADTAKHPITKRRYIDMVYQPMLELLAFLRANDFKTFIVSGGEIAFMRAWAQKVYGIPNYQVVGTSLKSTYQVVGDTCSIMRLPALDFMDDGPGKPVGIYQHIGKKPVFAAGNSDGDYQMLQWTASSAIPHMEIIIHHTDSAREWAYDHPSSIGQLDKALRDATKYGWLIIDMKNDWKEIFPKHD
jgi:haloacid dehalogenase-like hydrolase